MTGTIFLGTIVPIRLAVVRISLLAWSNAHFRLGPDAARIIKAAEVLRRAENRAVIPVRSDVHHVL
jgi:hypothetical protein